uniref:Uncharacterized protein n=1 Tax=Oncorhynchus mykiss TaxID=8022 RepID=A0A8K9Y365_ONCMY
MTGRKKSSVMRLGVMRSGLGPRGGAVGPPPSEHAGPPAVSPPRIELPSGLSHLLRRTEMDHEWTSYILCTITFCKPTDQLDSLNSCLPGPDPK